jgi:hypothetical protein
MLRERTGKKSLCPESFSENYARLSALVLAPFETRPPCLGVPLGTDFHCAAIQLETQPRRYALSNASVSRTIATRRRLSGCCLKRCGKRFC